MLKNRATTLNSKRILIVSPWGFRDGYSGPVVLLKRLFSEIRQRHDVHIDVLYRHGAGATVPNWVDRAFPVVADDTRGFGRRAQLDWAIRAAWFIARHAGEYRCVHLHGAYWVNLFPALFDRYANLSVLPVLERGDLALGRFPSSLAQRLLRRCAASKSVAVFCLSEGIAREAQASGWEEWQRVFIGNPVDEGAFLRVERKAPTRQGVRLGFVGKLGPTKQPDLVLGALALLLKDGIEATALFVGPFLDVNYENHFKERVAALGLDDRVSLTGFTNDVASHMSKGMDVFVLPSLAEGMPGALAEAMACGLPVIVTSVGEMGNVVNKSKAGIIVIPDAAAIADAVKCIIGDVQTYALMSEQAAVYAERNYSSRNIAESVFQRLFSNTRSDQRHD